MILRLNFKIILVLVLIGSAFKSPINAKDITMDDLTPWELCDYIGKMAYQFADIRINQNREPVIYPRRELTKFEWTVIRRINIRVIDLILEKEMDNPNDIAFIIYNECVKGVNI